MGPKRVKRPCCSQAASSRRRRRSISGSSTASCRPATHPDEAGAASLRGGDRVERAVLTLRATKEMLRRIAESRRLAPGEDADLIELCYASADFREGVASFLAKRKPVWTGT